MTFKTLKIIFRSLLLVFNTLLMQIKEAEQQIDKWREQIKEWQDQIKGMDKQPEQDGQYSKFDEDIIEVLKNAIARNRRDIESTEKEIAPMVDKVLPFTTH